MTDKWRKLFEKIYVESFEDRIGIKPLKIPKGDIKIDSLGLLESIDLVDKNDIKHVFNHRLKNPIPPHEEQDKPKFDEEQEIKHESFVNPSNHEPKLTALPVITSNHEPVEPPSQLPTIEDKPFEDMESTNESNKPSQTIQQETYNNFMNPDFDDEFASDEYDYALDHVI